MDLKEIKKILEYMDEHELAHFELSREDGSLILKKDGEESAAAPAPIVVAGPGLAAPVAGAAPEAAPVSSPKADMNEDTTSKNYIKSPMVGTFYRSPDPESESFIKPGDPVEEDTVVCIIESMKVMNEIKAGQRGKIVEVVAEDAKPVQFDEALFVIE